MATIQTALPWGSETRCLGPRKKPGLLFNLINWWLRKTGRCWANWKWIQKYLSKSGHDVGIPTLKRWFSRFAAQWGLQHVQIGARRWEFVRVEVIRQSDQTDTAKEVKPTELDTSTKRTEHSPVLESSVGVENVIPPQKIPDADFDRYYETFEQAGVSLNEGDRMRACREWVSLPEPDRKAATSDAMVLCASRKACYIPLPVNHLKSKAWTRVAKPRTLRVEKPAGFLRRMMGLS